MSNELVNPTVENILNSYRARLEELERRVLVLGDDPTDSEGCCIVLCCNSEPADDLATGESAPYCAVTLEETAGSALRLAVNAVVVVQAQAGGNVQFDAAVAVDATVYKERSPYRRTMTNGDKVPVPVTATIDSNVASPTVTIVVRNQDVTTIRVLSVVLQVLVYGVREGTTACGETAGTG